MERVPCPNPVKSVVPSPQPLPPPHGRKMVHILSAVSVSVNDSPLSLNENGGVVSGCKSENDEDYDEEFDDDDFTPPSSAEGGSAGGEAAKT
jgi:hypothetical protein